MKKIILPIFLILVIFELFAQTYKFPKEVIYYPERDLEDEEMNRYLETQGFYPIGWSPDGKFAYIVSYDGYADGACIIFVIQNLQSDKVVSAIEICEGGSSDEELSSQDLWLKIKTKAEQKLIQHNICQNTVKFEKGNKYSYDNQQYDFVLTMQNSIKITCKAKDLGSKTIYYQKISPEDFEYQYLYGEGSCYVSGIIKSPYEDRIAVVYYVFRKGFEFIKNEEFDVVGCHLKKGFNNK